MRQPPRRLPARYTTALCLDNIGSQRHTFIANADVCRPLDDVEDLVFGFAAERAVDGLCHHGRSCRARMGLRRGHSGASQVCSLVGGQMQPIGTGGTYPGAKPEQV